MARRKKDQTESPIESTGDGGATIAGEGAGTSEPVGAAPLETSGGVGGPAPRRLSFALTDDGRLDMNSLQDRTRERVKAIFADPEVCQEIWGTSAPPVESGWSEDDVERVYRLLGELQSQLVSKTQKVPIEVAREIFLFDQTETGALRGPSKAMFNKWARKAATVEAMWAITLLGIEQKKFFALAMWKAQHKVGGPQPTIETRQ